MGGTPICFLCGCKVRNPFAFKFDFWRPKPALFRFLLEVDGEEYGVRALLCDKDGQWAENNRSVAEVMLASKIKAFEKESNWEDESA